MIVAQDNRGIKTIKTKLTDQFSMNGLTIMTDN